MFQAKVVEKIRIQFYIQKRFSENRAVYEIMWENMIQSDRPEMTI
jgi:hypothetical protein